jgi:hypothetical protein
MFNPVRAWGDNSTNIPNGGGTRVPKPKQGAPFMGNGQNMNHQ